MADQTITETALDNGQIRYELGRPNWDSRRIPDINRPGSTTQVPENCLVDVVILGDGFAFPVEFREALEDWLDAFYALRVYDTFAGAYRIRALFTPSLRASSDRDSYYGCQLKDSTHIETKESWPSSDDAAGQRFRESFWASVDSFPDRNTRRYPADLALDDNIAVGNAQRDTYRNLIVAMLVRTADSANVSGMARNVPRDPDEPTTVRCAFGANTIHEFSHAFGYLSDEYINDRGTSNDRVNPSVPSVLTCSNLTYSDRDDSVPWLHLAPTGRFRRAAGGDDPPPVAGWLWVGGSVHEGVWHPEYRCLMNGSHDNFAFTQDATNDPTANSDGTYDDESGADLRDRDRFCAWCQEIVAIRTLERTDQFVDSDDPSNLTECGQVWFQRWLGLRENYYNLLGVGQQITDSEAAFAAMAPGRSGEPLWQSDLYTVPSASTAPASEPVPPLADDEILLLGSTR